MKGQKENYISLRRNEIEAKKGKRRKKSNHGKTNSNIDVQKQTQYNRIQKSRYSKRYKEMCTMEIPAYLRI